MTLGCSCALSEMGCVKSDLCGGSGESGCPFAERKDMIYVIDDDQSIRRAFQRLLRSDNLPVTVFSSGEEFLENAVVGNHDCLILDIRMPRMSGFDLLEELRLRRIRIPVIVVSAFDDSESRERSKQLGAEAFFRKPVDDQALLDSVHWAIGAQ
jgi:FixJ family two-component response regulator